MTSVPPDAGTLTPAEIRCGGLLRRRPGWGLTRRGRLLLAVVALGCVAGFILGIHPFLAVRAPVASELLVVEGWASDDVLHAAALEFGSGDYARVYVTGGPIERGAPLSEYGTYAALGAAVMAYFGTPTNVLQAVPAPRVRRDRTYTTAVMLREWLDREGKRPSALNVVTVGPHARRSRLLYEKAFGRDCRIGVIPVASGDYDSRRWWAYSAGVRTVLGETVAYLYARCLFRVSADHQPWNGEGED